jgi:AraC family transcriptional regulator, ethanolamine operon transcriptional activator
MGNGLDNHGIIKTSDVEQHREIAKPWDVSFVQLTKGSFQGEMEYARFDEIIVYREHWNQKLHVTGSSPKGFIMLGTTTSENTHVRWCGEDLGSQNYAFSDGVSEVDFVTSLWCQHVVMLVPQYLLAQYIDEESLAYLSVNRHCLQSDPYLNKQFISLLNNAINRYHINRDLSSDQIVSKTIAANLLAMAVKFIVGNRECKADKNSPQHYLNVTQRAINYVASNNIFSPIKIPDFAKAIGVSQRALEYAFQETLGITPSTFLKNKRMHRLHLELLVAEPSTTTITELALNYGFTEMGRLASEYKQLFGELPSTTFYKTLSTEIVFKNAF